MKNFPASKRSVVQGQMAYEPQVAAIYDLFCLPDRSEEAAFWAAMAGPPPARLLEPMVGTAEVALMLVDRGYSVTGVDFSGSMLDVADARRRSRGTETGNRLTLIEGDIARIDLPAGRFDLAFVSSGSWNLLTDSGERREALRNIRKSLRTGGRLAMELFPPLTRSGATEPRTFKPIRPAPEGFEVEKTSFMVRDIPAQSLEIHEQIKINDRVIEHLLTLQILPPEQVIAEWMAAGFTRPALYGNYGLEAFQPGVSRMMIAIAGIEQTGCEHDVVGKA